MPFTPTSINRFESRTLAISHSSTTYYYLIDTTTTTTHLPVMLTMFSGTKIAEMPPTSSQLRPPHLRNRGTSTSSVPTSNSETINTTDAQERRRLEHHEADVVIVGAGIVGCAAAVAFGKQGRSVLLLERSLKEPDRIVGELLQPGGVNALEKLGMKGVYTPLIS